MTSDGLGTTTRANRARWQFSLSRLMAITTSLCICLAVLRLGVLLFDRRTVPFLITAIVLVFSKGAAMRGAALGGIVGLCFGMARFEVGRIPISEELFTVAAAGACGAWFGAAFQATKRGYETVGLLALLPFFVWFTFWLCP